MKVPLKPIEEPWLGFLRAVDAVLLQPTEIHCIGGFALLLLLERTRPTLLIARTARSRAPAAAPSFTLDRLQEVAAQGRS